MPANHKTPHTLEARAKISASHTGIPALWKRRAIKVVGGVELYICVTCKEFKPREDFYTNKRTLLGIKSQCKKCHVTTSMATRNKDNSRRINREYARRARAKNPEKFRAKERQASRNRVTNNKTQARYLLNLAVKRGDIKKP